METYEEDAGNDDDNQISRTPTTAITVTTAMDWLDPALREDTTSSLKRKRAESGEEEGTKKKVVSVTFLA